MVRLLGGRGRKNRVAQRYLAAIEGDKIEVTPESPAHSKSTRRTTRTECSDSWTPTVRRRQADDSSLTTGSDELRRRSRIENIGSEAESDSFVTASDEEHRQQPRSLNAAVETGLDMLLYSNAFSCNGVPNRTKWNYKKQPRQSTIPQRRSVFPATSPQRVSVPTQRKTVRPDRPPNSPTRSDFTGAETEIATNRAVDLAMRRIQAMESGNQAARWKLEQDKQLSLAERSLISESSNDESHSVQQPQPISMQREQQQPPPTSHLPDGRRIQGVSEPSNRVVFGIENSSRSHSGSHAVVVHPDEVNTIDSMSVDVGQGPLTALENLGSAENDSVDGRSGGGLMIPYLESKQQTVKSGSFQNATANPKNNSNCLSPPEIERMLPSQRSQQESPDPIFCSKSPSFMSQSEGSFHSGGAIFMEKPTPDRPTEPLNHKELVTKRWPPLKSSLLSGRWFSSRDKNSPSPELEILGARPRNVSAPAANHHHTVPDLPMDTRPVPLDPYDNRPPPSSVTVKQKSPKQNRMGTSKSEIFRTKDKALVRKLSSTCSDIWDDIDADHKSVDVRSLRSVFESIASPNEPENVEKEDDDTASVKSLRERFEPSVRKGEQSEKGSTTRSLRSLFESSASPDAEAMQVDDDTSSVKSLRKNFEPLAARIKPESEVSKMKKLFESKMLPASKRFEGTSKMREKYELYEPIGLRQSRDSRGVGRGRLVSRSPLGERIKSWLKQQTEELEDDTLDQTKMPVAEASVRDAGLIQNERFASVPVVNQTIPRADFGRYHRPSSKLEQTDPSSADLPGKKTNTAPNQNLVSRKNLQRGFHGLQVEQTPRDSPSELWGVHDREEDNRFDSDRFRQERHESPAHTTEGKPIETELLTSSRATTGSSRQTSSPTSLTRRAEVLARSRFGRRTETGEDENHNPMNTSMGKDNRKEMPKAKNMLDVETGSQYKTPSPANPEDDHKSRKFNLSPSPETDMSLNGQESSDMVQTGSDDSSSLDSGSDYSDGVTLDASIANVSALTNPTALVGSPLRRKRRGRKNSIEREYCSGDETPKSSRGLETKKSEASSTQPSDAALPLIGGLLRMSDEVSADSINQMPFQRLMSRSKSSEWEGFSQKEMQEDRHTRTPAAFHYEPPLDDDDGCWNIEHVQSLFPSDFRSNPFAGHDAFDCETWEPFPSSAGNFDVPSRPHSPVSRPHSPMLNEDELVFADSVGTVSPILQNTESPQLSRADSLHSCTSSSVDSTDMSLSRSSSPCRDVGFGSRFTEVAAKLLSEGSKTRESSTTETQRIPARVDDLDTSCIKPTTSPERVDLSLIAPKTRIIGLAEPDNPPRIPAVRPGLAEPDNPPRIPAVRPRTPNYSFVDGFSDAQRTPIGRTTPSPANSRATTPTLDTRSVLSPASSSSAPRDLHSQLPTVTLRPRTPTEARMPLQLDFGALASQSKPSSIISDERTPTTVNVTPTGSDVTKTPVRGNVSRLIKSVTPSIRWASRHGSNRDPPPYVPSGAVSTTGYSLAGSHNSESVTTTILTTYSDSHSLRGFRSRAKSALLNKSEETPRENYSPKYTALKSRLRELKTHRLQRAAAARSIRTLIPFDEDDFGAEESFSSFSKKKHGSYSFLAKLETSI